MTGRCSGNQAGDDPSGDRTQADADHRMSGGDHHVRPAGGASQIGQTVGRTRSESAPRREALEVAGKELREIGGGGADNPADACRIDPFVEPPISIVPPKRTAPPIGVTATRASVRIELRDGIWRGWGSVRLYPLPACMGMRRSNPRARDSDQLPPAMTHSSASTSDPSANRNATTRPLAVRGPETPPVPQRKRTPSRPASASSAAMNRPGARWQSPGSIPPPPPAW